MAELDIGMIVLLVFLSLLGIGLLKGTLFQIEQQNVGIIQRLGKYKRLANPGLNVKVPIIEKLAGEMTLRIQQLEVKVESITNDKVTVLIKVSLQYKVLEGLETDKIDATTRETNIRDAFYKLVNAKQQIESYVFDIVRARVPTMKLDSVFENKDEIAQAVKDGLNTIMKNYGYQIITALVTGIDPDANVLRAMNEINANERLKVANEQKGEAEKILIIKQSEAQRAKMILHGEGIAGERTAIINGLRDMIKSFAEQTKINDREVAAFVLATNWLDTMKEVGAKDKSHVIFIPWSLTMANDMAQAVTNMVSVTAAIEGAKAIDGAKDVDVDPKRR